MKTLHFPENYDLCRPSVDCENSNNNSNSIANTHGHSSKAANSSRVVTYGKNSIEQSSKFEKNNENQLKQQQQQEQNKKRKRDTGEYLTSSLWNKFYSSSFHPSFLHMSSISHSFVPSTICYTHYIKNIFLETKLLPKNYIYIKFRQQHHRHHWTRLVKNNKRSLGFFFKKYCDLFLW